MGADRPKQYLFLGGQTLLERSVRCLLADARVRQVLVVVGAQDGLAATLALPPRCVVLAEGGTTRAQTVRNGLAALRAGRAGVAVADDDWVLVHDAARPCLSAAELAALIDAGAAGAADGGAGAAQGALLALPLSDTVKAGADDGRVARTVPRAGLWRALTPQFFPVGVLARALEQGAQQPEVTDESAAVERLGLRPRLIAGSPGNIKVTTPGDLALAEAILRQAGAWQAE
jgi:2-C-methyl-D-erythritol 4-phosphate cytidylyltransferase